MSANKFTDKFKRDAVAQILLENNQLVARVTNMLTPAPGNMIRIGLSDFIVQGGAKLHRNRRIWTGNASSA